MGDETPEIKQPVRTGRERSLANLHPFGKDHQPVRRGHGKRRDGAYRWAAKQIPLDVLLAQIRKVFPSIRGKIDSERAIALSMTKEAITGNVQAAKEFFDSLYGKARESVDHTTKGDKITQTIFNVLNQEQREKIEDAHNHTDDI